MGLPEISIEFKGKAVTAIKRSALGIVALILKDDISSFLTKEYKDVSELNSSEFTTDNAEYIKQAFMGSPSKVIVEVVAADATDYNGALTRLNSKKWNYLAIPGIESSDVTLVSSWIKTKRDTDKKTFKAVLPNAEADHEGVINFTTTDIVVGNKTYTTSQYTARIAGILAGIPFTRSPTYYELSEVDAITEHITPNEDIENGELILINDGENIKIGRGVNSFKSTTVTKTEDFKKIKVVEAMDMIKDDIQDTFDKNYVGKMPNTYDNQVLFFVSVNAYFKGLQGDFVLDSSFENKATVDVEAQRLAWEGIGTDTSSWDEQKVKNMSFKSNVFAFANVKIVDAVEDLKFNIEI